MEITLRFDFPDPGGKSYINKIRLSQKDLIDAINTPEENIRRTVTEMLDKSMRAIFPTEKKIT